MSAEPLRLSRRTPSWAHFYLSRECRGDHWPYWIEGRAFCGCARHFGQPLLFEPAEVAR